MRTVYTLISLLFWLAPALCCAQSWTSLGTGDNILKANGRILGLCADSKGHIYVSGFFAHADGMRDVYKWDGYRWSIVGGDSSRLNANGVIYTLSTDEDDNIYAAGYFFDSPGNRHFVTKWDGHRWEKLGTGSSALNANGDILSLCTDRQGNVYATGRFTDPAGENYIARWDGQTWTNIGNGGTHILNARTYLQPATTPDGHIYAIYSGWYNGKYTYVLSYWDKTQWTDVVIDTAHSYGKICVDNKGNAYSVFSDMHNAFIGRWNPSLREVSRIAIGNGYPSNLYVRAMCTDTAGNVYMTASGGGGAYGRTFVAKWDGRQWSELLHADGNALKIDGQVESMCTDLQGNVYVAGWFSSLEYRYGVMKYTPPPPPCPPSVYPNPATTELHTRCIPEHTVVAITDITERVLFTQIIDKDNTLYVGHLPPGVYFLKSRRGNVKFLKL